MKSEQRMKGIPQITPANFLNVATTYMGGRTPSQAKPMMLWGAPGIGKSDTVRAVAEQLSKVHGKPCYVHDVRLSLYNPTDLKGMPYADKENKKTIWLKPEIFDMVDDNSCINILFLDELTNATPSVAAAAYQLILDRAIATHTLASNCYIICAGNRTIDKSATNKMPAPLANRLMHFEFAADVDSWKAWAMSQSNFCTHVIAFILYNSKLLFTYEPGKDEVAFPTPRSWEAVARLLANVSEPAVVDSLFPLVEANVGSAAAGEFLAFMHVYADLPDIMQILSGQYHEVPTAPDLRYALSASLATHALSLANNSEDLNFIEMMMNNLLNYSLKLPVEFQVLILISCISSVKIKQALVRNPVFTNWIAQNKSVLPGVQL